MKAIVVTTCGAALVAALAGCSSSSKSTADNSRPAGPPAQSSVSSTTAQDPGTSGDSGSTSGSTGAGSAPAGDAAGGKYPDPCTLITNDDAQTFLGGPLKTKGVYAPDPNIQGGHCTWDTGANGLVLTAGDPAVLGELAKTMGKPLSGLGDEAFATNATVYFRKGDVGVRVNGGGKPKDDTIALARAVLAKL
jgi:hypothetical protein